MKNKLLKTLTRFASISAIGSTIAITSTSCGCSSQSNLICSEFNNLSDFANYNFNNYKNNLGINKPNCDYTDNGKYTDFSNWEYAKNITKDLKQDNIYFQNFLCQSFLGIAESVLAQFLINASGIKNISKDEIYTSFTQATETNNFFAKFNYPKNIKWSTEIKDNAEYDVVSFTDLSFHFDFNFQDDNYSYDIDIDPNVELNFDGFRFDTGSYKDDHVLQFELNTFNSSNSFHIKITTPRGIDEEDMFSFGLISVFFPNSSEILTQSSGVKFISI